METEARIRTVNSALCSVWTGTGQARAPYCFITYPLAWGFRLSHSARILAGRVVFRPSALFEKNMSSHITMCVFFATATQNLSPKIQSLPEKSVHLDRCHRGIFSCNEAYEGNEHDPVENHILRHAMRGTSHRCIDREMIREIRMASIRLTNLLFLSIRSGHLERLLGNSYRSWTGMPAVIPPRMGVFYQFIFRRNSSKNGIRTNVMSKSKARTI
jgi:hypothetical protein